MIPMEKEKEIEIYTLVDDDGVENEFTIRMKKEFEGKMYCVLVPVNPIPDFEEGDFVVFRCETDPETNEETLVWIKDDEEHDRAADFFGDLLYGGEINYDTSENH